MTKLIKHTEVREGDKIRVFRDGIVTTAPDENSADFQLDGKHWVFDDLFEESEYQIELLDRPIDLPTKVGSIVEVKGSFNAANWMLTDKGGWVSDRNIFKDAEDFKDFLKHYDWKVIL